MLIGPIGIDVLLPTNITFKQSLMKSLGRINLGEVRGTVDTLDFAVLGSNTQEIRRNNSNFANLLLPKRTSVEINRFNVKINDTDLNIANIYCLMTAKTVMKLRIEVQNIDLTRHSEPLISIPMVDVEGIYQENQWEVNYMVDFVYIAMGTELADFLSLSIPVKPPFSVPISTLKPDIVTSPWTQSISISTIQISLSQDSSEFLRGQISSLEVTLSHTSTTEVTISCDRAEVTDPVSGIYVVDVGEPEVGIEASLVTFACGKVCAHWVKSLHEICYPVILKIIRCFTNRHRKKYKTNTKKGKNVNLDFSNVTAIVTFGKDESMRAEVASFQTDIISSDKVLFLAFTKSELYIQEVEERLLLTCQELSVCKRYVVKDRQVVAQIDVDGGDTELIVPEQYPWGRAVFKSTVGIIAGIKWTMSLLFPGVPVIPHIVFMEKAVTYLTLSKTKVVIMDTALQNSIRKKLLLKPDYDIYPQLKSLISSPFLLLNFDMTTGVFDNTRLGNAQKALEALQEMDPFEIPSEDYFAFIMANDMKMVFSGCWGQLRDFPWRLYKVATLKLKGRSMINKNRLPVHNWSRWKIHSNMTIRLSNVEFTLGLCLLSSLFDVSCKQILDLAKRMIIRRGDPPVLTDKTPRLAMIDRLRYVFNGVTRTKITGLSVNLLTTEYPLAPPQLNIHIDMITAAQSPQVLDSMVSGLTVTGLGSRPICCIPLLNSTLSYRFLCDDPNPWIRDLDFETHDAFKPFRMQDIELSSQVDFSVANGNTMEITYDAATSASLCHLLLFHVKPPAILLQRKRQKRRPIWTLIREIKVNKVTLHSPRVILLTSEGVGLQMTIDKISGCTTVTRSSNPVSKLPFEITESSAVCSFIHLCAFNGTTLSPIYPKEFEEYQKNSHDFTFGADQTMMTCLSVQFLQDEEVAGRVYQKYLTVAGLRLLWTKRLESIMWQLLTIDPAQLFAKFARRKQKKKEPFSVPADQESLTPIITAPDFTSSAAPRLPSSLITSAVSFYMEVIQPQFNLQNENTLAQMLMLAGVARCEISTYTLAGDVLGLDAKTVVRVEVESVETFVAPGMVDLRRPVCWLETAQQMTPSLDETEAYQAILRRVFTSKSMSCSVTHFRLPYNKLDMTDQSYQANKYKWSDETRSNEVKITLPEVQATMESEHLWTLIDVIQGVLFQIDGSQRAETVSELLKYDEIRKFGREEICNGLKERLNKEQWFKVPRLLKSITISLDSIAFRMTKNHEVMLAVDISKVLIETTITHMNSSTKAFSIHQITVMHEGNSVLRPLVLEGEDFHDSNMMITLRSSERYLTGKSQATWHVFEHLEVYLFPLVVEITPALYKDIYAFIFPAQEEMDDEQKEAILVRSTTSSRRAHIRKDILKPLSRRKRLPHFFHYCHFNEIKTSLSIGGWMGLNNTKITIKPFIRHAQFCTAQEIWDKYMKSAGKCVVKQVPSVILQGLGREKRDFLPSKESSSKGLFGIFKKKKREEEEKDHKLMFGSY